MSDEDLWKIAYEASNSLCLIDMKPHSEFHSAKKGYEAGIKECVKYLNERINSMSRYEGIDMSKVIDIYSGIINVFEEKLLKEPDYAKTEDGTEIKY